MSISLKSVLVITKPNCPHCKRAKEALRSEALHYMEYAVESKERIKDPKLVEAVAPMKTFPMVLEISLLDGYKLIGGADELEEHLLHTDLLMYARTGVQEPSVYSEFV